MMTPGRRAQREQMMFADVLGRETPENPGWDTDGTVEDSGT